MKELIVFIEHRARQGMMEWYSFVDGIAKASWSGINPWTYHEPISEGSHTLEWRYFKDGSDFFGLGSGMNRCGTFQPVWFCKP